MVARAGRQVREATEANDSAHAMRARHVLRALRAAHPAAVLLHAAPARAEVIDEIWSERHDSGARARMRFTAPVHCLRHCPADRGAIVNGHLHALAPDSCAVPMSIEVAKDVPKSAVAAHFSVRVSLDPRCEAAPTRSAACCASSARFSIGSGSARTAAASWPAFPAGTRPIFVPPQVARSPDANDASQAAS